MDESYKKIDYRLRPAKNVERKMLAEAFNRLSKFARVNSYRYIGMGSLYFSDFILFHRSLGFQKMISIEKEDKEPQRERFNFNKPFNCVDIKFGFTSKILPNLDWDTKDVIWLDYDGKLDLDILKDVFLISSQITPGSLFLISVNTKLSGEKDENGKEFSKLKFLETKVGEDKIPVGTKNENLSGWKAAEIYRQIINNEIADGLTERNLILKPNERIQYQQIFNFHYEDGVKMLTIGGIFYTEELKAKLKECAFDELDFYRPTNEAYSINAPILTFKEVRALNACLPLSDDCEQPLPPISESDKNKYSQLYRYYPTFTESEV